MTINEEFEELKDVIGEIVTMFKTVWDEVEHQFSELPSEERRRIFSLIAPLVTNVFAMATRESVIEDTAKPISKRKKKR